MAQTTEGFWCPNSFPECERAEQCCYPDMCRQAAIRRAPQLSDEELRDEYWFLPEVETTK